MCATPSGKALIINNEYFLDKRLKRRDGTNKDCEDIEQVFEDLDFIIVKKQNLELDVSSLFVKFLFDSFFAKCFENPKQ